VASYLYSLSAGISPGRGKKTQTRLPKVDRLELYCNIFELRFCNHLNYLKKKTSGFFLSSVNVQIRSQLRSYNIILLYIIMFSYGAHTSRKYDRRVVGAIINFTSNNISTSRAYIIIYIIIILKTRVDRTAFFPYRRVSI